MTQLRLGSGWSNLEDSRRSLQILHGNIWPDPWGGCGWHQTEVSSPLPNSWKWQWLLQRRQVRPCLKLSGVPSCWRSWSTSAGLGWQCQSNCRQCWEAVLCRLSRLACWLGDKQTSCLLVTADCCWLNSWQQSTANPEFALQDQSWG